MDDSVANSQEAPKEWPGRLRLVDGIVEVDFSSIEDRVLSHLLTSHLPNIGTPWPLVDPAEYTATARKSTDPRSWDITWRPRL